MMFEYNVTKEEAEKVLLFHYGRVQVKCGQDIVTLVNVAESPMKRVIMVYVNDVIKAEWLDIDSQDREAQYLRVSTRKTYPKSFYKDAPAKARKKLSESTYQIRQAYFSTPKSAIRHLLKVCPAATFKSNLNPA